MLIGVTVKHFLELLPAFQPITCHHCDKRAIKDNVDIVQLYVYESTQKNASDAAFMSDSLFFFFLKAGKIMGNNCLGENNAAEGAVHVWGMKCYINCCRLESFRRKHEMGVCHELPWQPPRIRAEHIFIPVTELNKHYISDIKLAGGNRESGTYLMSLGEEFGELRMPPFRCFFLGDSADCWSSSTAREADSVRGRVGRQEAAAVDSQQGEKERWRG